jgi:hypothetical protein
MNNNSEYTLTDLDGKVYIIPNVKRNKKSYDLRESLDLSSSNLARETVGGIDLTNAKLIGANFQDSYLFNADLSGANLRGVDLSGAELYGANLSGTDLSGANLSGANMEDANLKGALLEGIIIGKFDSNNTDLTGADLTNAVIWLPKLTHIAAKSIRENAKYNSSITRDILSNPNSECDEAISKLLMARIDRIRGLESMFTNYGCDPLKRLFLSFKASNIKMFKKAVNDYILDMRGSVGPIIENVSTLNQTLALFETHVSLLKRLIGDEWTNKYRKKMLVYFEKKASSALFPVFAQGQLDQYIDACQNVSKIKRNKAKFHNLAEIANENYYNVESEYYMMLSDDEKGKDKVLKYICDNGDEFQLDDIIFIGSSYETRQEYGFYILSADSFDNIVLASSEWFYYACDLDSETNRDRLLEEYLSNFGSFMQAQKITSPYTEQVKNFYKDSVIQACKFIRTNFGSDQGIFHV